MPASVLHLLESYGYLLVFASVFLQNAGIPLPGETMLVAAAFLAQRHVLGLPGVILAGMGGAVAGAVTGFAIGLRGGRALAERHGAKVGLTRARLAIVEQIFTKHGAKIVFYSRFVIGLRPFAAPFAGITGLSWRRFVPWTVAGAALWATTMGIIGYAFGSSWNVLEQWIGRIAYAVAAMALALVVVIVWRRLKLSARIRIREILLGTGLLLAAGIFMLITELVFSGKTRPWDDGILLALHAVANPVLHGVAEFFTIVGSVETVVPAILLMIFWSQRRKDSRAMLAMAVVALAAELVDVGLKDIFMRARPALWAGVDLPDSYSFPSGHSMNSAATYSMIAVLIGRFLPRYRMLAYVIAPILVLCIGTSRLVLAVHWPSDVAGGFTGGIFILLCGVLILGRTPDPTAPAAG